MRPRAVSARSSKTGTLMILKRSSEETRCPATRSGTSDATSSMKKYDLHKVFTGLAIGSRTQLEAALRSGTREPQPV